jgi:hypothetical protein
MRGEPVPTAVRREMIFGPFAFRVMQANPFCILYDNAVDAMPFKSFSSLANE